ncbi:MAG TPA: GerAB/ArcD/ProY family transporter [Bacillota bacterium]|nr:GerAB/ArcD/ProY family transporter [Bacillota bacterium]
MKEQIKLTREQVFFLTMLGVMGNLVYIHTWIDDLTDRAAWVAAFLGVLMVIPLAVWLVFLGNSLPSNTIFELLEKGLGKPVLIPMGLVFIVINIAIAVTQLNMFTQMINVYFLEFTPPWVIMLFLVFMGTLFAEGGVQIFARLTESMAVLGIFDFFVAFFLAFPKYIHPEYVFPVFDTTWTGFIKGALFITGGAAECLLLLMVIVSYIPDARKHYLWVVTGISGGGLVVTSAILIIIAMMSPELAKSVAFGGVNAANLIQIQDFVQGLEIFMFGSYQIIAIGKITITIYCAWMVLRQIFADRLPLLLLLLISFLVLTASIWLTSYNRAYSLAVVLSEYVILPFCLIVLLLTSASLVIIKKRTGGAAK